MGKEFVGDSAQQVVSYDRVPSEPKTCVLCGRETVGCLYISEHAAGICPTHAFLHPNIDNYFQEDELGETMNEDDKRFKEFNNEDTQPPIGYDDDTARWELNELEGLPRLIEGDEDTEERFDYDGPTEPMDAIKPNASAVKLETQRLPESSLRNKLRILFDREQTTTLDLFINRLKDAIDYSIEHNLSVIAFALQDKVTEDKLINNEISVDKAARLVTFVELQRLHEGLVYLARLKAFRDQGQFPDRNLRQVVKAFLDFKMNVPYKITFNHQEDLANSGSEGTNSLNSWLKTLILQRPNDKT